MPRGNHKDLRKRSSKISGTNQDASLGALVGQSEITHWSAEIKALCGSIGRICASLETPLSSNRVQRQGFAPNPAIARAIGKDDSARCQRSRQWGHSAHRRGNRTHQGTATIRQYPRAPNVSVRTVVKRNHADTTTQFNSTSEIATTVCEVFSRSTVTSDKSFSET